MRRHQAFRGLFPGLFICAFTAVIAIMTTRQRWLVDHGVGALSLAVVLGMLARYAWGTGASGPSVAGVEFARHRILRLGIVLYGLRLTVRDLAQLGVTGALIDVAMMASTFLLALHLGSRMRGVDRCTAALIGAGASVCGAAAVMAMAPVVRARPEQQAIAVLSVVVMGTLSIFIYPALHALVHQWALFAVDDHAFGVYIGSTVHEVAQVVATAQSISAESASSAVVAKMLRVLLLAPFLTLAAAARLGNGAQSPGEESPAAAQRPWFVAGFLAVVLINSWTTMSPGLRDALIGADTLLLAMAMSAVGMCTSLAQVRSTGRAPLILAAYLLVWLVVGGAMINGAFRALQ